MDIRLGCEKNEFVDGMNRGYMPYFPPAMMPTAPTSFVLPEYNHVLPQRPPPSEGSNDEGGASQYPGLSSQSSPDNSMPSPSSATSSTSSSSPSSSLASSDNGGSDAGNKRKGTCNESASKLQRKRKYVN